MAHELADELQLATLCTMRRKALVVGDGLAYCIRQCNLGELVCVQLGESAADFLQLARLTLTLRFTDFQIRHVPG